MRNLLLVVRIKSTRYSIVTSADLDSAYIFTWALTYLARYALRHCETDAHGEDQPTAKFDFRIVCDVIGLS